VADPSLAPRISQQITHHESQLSAEAAAILRTLAECVPVEAEPEQEQARRQA
jgi:hypothetical protein